VLPLEFFKSSTNIRLPQRELLEEAKDVIRFYEGLFGPFPYEKLTIVQRVWFTAGGHSPASFIIINEMPQFVGGKRRFLNSRSPADFSRWKGYFLAHEIAHQWWGQGVTWKTYHDQWLSEGLAQFSSILYLSQKYGDKVLDSIVKKLSQWTEKKSDWGAITMGSRLSYFDFETFQSIIYNKASLALLMLKDILGEEVFFQGIKDFFALHKYGAASTYDFIKAFNRVSGKDLGPFFKGWFDTHILPEVDVSHTLLRQEEGFLLRLNISQKSDLFVFPILVEWTQKGREVSERLLIDEREKRFEFKLDDKPRKIKFNSDKAVPGKFK
jgi:aminopeptidase N